MEQRKNILFVIGSLAVGGTEKHLLQISKELKFYNITPTIYCLSGDGPLTSCFEKNQIKVIDGSKWTKFFLWLPPKIKGFVFQLCNILQLTAFLYKTKFDIVHSFLPQACIVAGFATWLNQHPYFITSRRSLNHYQKNKIVAPFFETWAMRRSLVILGNSKAVLADLVSEGFQKSQMGLIYNGIEVPTLERQNLREQENIEPETFIFILVANLIPYKGHLDLFTALSIAKNQFSFPWVLLCVGSGDESYLNVLKNHAAELGILKNIKFLGCRHDVDQLYKSANIGFLVSEQEGFSNSLLEGMACGVPMIVTDVGGNTEIVEQDKNGIIVPAKNPSMLADAIKRLVFDAKLCSEFSSRAKEKIMKFYSIKRCAQMYFNLYNNLPTLKEKEGVPLQSIIEGSQC